MPRTSDRLTGQVSKLAKAKAMVVSDPEIRGGEPVINGTCIGVYEVATMLQRGAGKEETLSGYPTLRPGEEYHFSNCCLRKDAVREIRNRVAGEGATVTRLDAEASVKMFVAALRNVFGPKA